MIRIRTCTRIHMNLIDYEYEHRALATEHEYDPFANQGDIATVLRPMGY